MKNKEIVNINIDKMNFGGESENNTSYEKKIVMKGGIQGQVIKAIIQKKRKDKIQAKILEVLKKSPIETQDVCGQFGKCGGCTYLSISYENQIKIKKEQLLDLFHKNSHYDIKDIDIVTSPIQQEYKNKMEFTFGNEEKDGELVIGLHKKNSSMSIIPVEDCKIVDEDYRKILKMTGNYFKNQNLPHYHIISHIGYLRHLVIRKGINTGEILINLVSTSQINFDLSEYVNLLNELSLNGKIIGILNTINDSLSDTVIADKTKVLYGRDYFYDELLGKKFKISAFSFFQTNTKAAEVLYKTAIDMIDGEKDTIFDLYSGTGTIAISLSSRAKNVIGIEIIDEAVKMAKENAIFNNIKNVTFISGDVKEEVKKLSTNPELIILDPPRAGINPKALKDIIDFNSKEILYISCNPKMFVQDLIILKERGYIIKEIKAVDMFPNTYHVEIIALLSKLGSKDYISVELPLDGMDLTSAESKATYKQIQNYVFEKYGFKVSNLYIAQVKRKFGLEIREHYNISKKENQKAPQCPIEKEEAIVDALRYFKMM